MFQYEELNKQFIGGRWRDGSSRNVLENRNPYTQKVITSFRKATPDDVDAAYRAAALAKQEWDKVNPFKKRA
ncbi:aldehyde dehydrogenase family protein, partial [Bacillus velezensis]